VENVKTKNEKKTETRESRTENRQRRKERERVLIYFMLSFYSHIVRNLNMSSSLTVSKRNNIRIFRTLECTVGKVGSLNRPITRLTEIEKPTEQILFGNQFK
jgi:hypothetical protein